MLIKGRSVTLRAPELADLPLINKWSNDPEIWRNVGGWHFPFSLRSTQQWIESREDNNATNQVFCIDAPDIGLVGTANLVNIDWKDRNAFHGMVLGNKDLRGKGIAVDAVFALMRYAFDELGLHRLDGSIIAYNQRSFKFYQEKCGWKAEGILRDWYYRDGKFHDKHVFGITEADYRDHCAKTNYWASPPA